jgi:putative aminopeptidase FrvX
MHTPSEVVDLQDLDNAIELIAGFLESLRIDENWIP